MIINLLSYNIYLNRFSNNNSPFFTNKKPSKIDGRYFNINNKDELLMSPSSIKKENEEVIEIDQVFKRARELIKNE
jgi:hypothetical protein